MKLLETHSRSRLQITADIFFQKKLGNGFFGGEGMFNTRITGPGHIWLQTMPASVLAGSIIPFLPPSGS